MPLTRLLYDTAHVHASLILSFATATTILEPLFWCNELLMSGFEVEAFDALWTAYYATCAIDYPHIAKYIIELSVMWSNNSSKCGNEYKEIHHIVSKIFTCARSTVVLNHYAHHTYTNGNQESDGKHKPVSVLRGKTPTWVSTYNPLAHQVLRHIQRKNPDKAIALITHSNNIEFINAVIEACTDYLGEPHAKPSIYVYKNSHIIIAKLHALTIILRKLPHEPPSYKPLFPIPPLCEPNLTTESHRHSLVGPDVNDTDLAIPTTFTKPLIITETIPWKILRTNRLFPHHPHTYIFALKPPPSFEDVRDRWLNLCIDSPIWFHRVKFCGGSITHDNNVIFNDAKNEQEFYTKYDMEFDEQPLHIQQMSTRLDSI